MSNSSEVAVGSQGTHTQYNNLRLDVLGRLSVVYSEDIDAGELINLINDGGTLKAELTYSGAVLDADNYMGVAAETGTTGQTKKVTLLGGIDTNQTSRTPGALQYISDTGTFTETADTNGIGGIAISATEVFLYKDF